MATRHVKGEDSVLWRDFWTGSADRRHRGRGTGLRRCGHPQVGPEPRLGQDRVRERAEGGQATDATTTNASDDRGRDRKASPRPTSSLAWTSSSSPIASGAARPDRRAPSRHLQRGALAEITDGVAFLPTFGNCSAFTTDDGLFMVDTGSAFTAPTDARRVRAVVAPAASTPPSSPTATSTTSSASGSSTRRPRPTAGRAPRVMAHEHLPRRFDRYVLTAGYNQVINRRQFGAGRPGVAHRRTATPTRPTSTSASLHVGGLEVHLRHEKGETDDATVTWIPSRGVLCTGDLFVWSSPNAGNPQKVQRYPREWAQALRRMARTGRASSSCPATVCPIVGPRAHPPGARPRPPSTSRALVDQTLALMNEGARLSDVLRHGARPRPPAGPALPPARLRRAGVHRAQHLAPLRRVVGRKPRHPQAGRATGASPPSSPSWSGGAPAPRRARRGPPRAGLGPGDAPRWSPRRDGVAAAPDDHAVCESRRQRSSATAPSAATSTMARGVFQLGRAREHRQSGRYRPTGIRLSQIRRRPRLSE